MLAEAELFKDLLTARRAGPEGGPSAGGRLAALDDARLKPMLLRVVQRLPEGDAIRKWVRCTAAARVWDLCICVLLLVRMCRPCADQARGAACSAAAA